MKPEVQSFAPVFSPIFNYFEQAFYFMFVIILFAIIMGIIVLILFIFASIGLHRLAANASMPNAWMAFIPFLHAYLLGKVVQDQCSQSFADKLPIILLVANIGCYFASAIPVVGTIVYILSAIVFFYACRKVYNHPSCPPCCQYCYAGYSCPVYYLGHSKSSTCALSCNRFCLKRSPVNSFQQAETLENQVEKLLHLIKVPPALTGKTWTYPLNNKRTFSLTNPFV
ncbi:hypothetical protein SAMN05421736_11463 [Evansella caseinilytica]|uniref:Uncharacterized protein n=1 Tax=Evansella caseinilytica TaxID=1503961 RepID=A0A1H3TF49_9BACI|nr:hypothetical protein SAMN05421736_11463 [Evansella caseinilytica]